MRTAKTPRWVGGAFIGALLSFCDTPATLDVLLLHLLVVGSTLIGIAIIGNQLAAAGR